MENKMLHLMQLQLISQISAFSIWPVQVQFLLVELQAEGRGGEGDEAFHWQSLRRRHDVAALGVVSDGTASM